MKKTALGKLIEKELTTAVLNRMSSVDLDLVTPPIMKQNKATFDDVEEILNIPYLNRGETPLAMDIFRKKGTEDEEVPVIVLVHGGGFCLGDRKISRPLGRWLADKGYLVFSVEYRLLPKVDVLQELDDVCAGLDLIGKRLVDYNVDFSRIYLVAESAGAFLSTFVTAMHDSKKLQAAIGHKPSRFRFKAMGLICGMFFSDGQGPMAEAMFGAKTNDPVFRKYMNPENPEIINNLPPVYLITSKGDFINDGSFRMHQALDKAGKENHLSYYGGDDLVHAFNVLQIDNPKTRKLMDKMLVWFEEQSLKSVEKDKEQKALDEKLENLKKSIEAGKLNGLKIWQYMEERNVYSKNAVMLIDGTREYTFGQISEERDRYARVFSGLNMTHKNGTRVAVAGPITAEPLFSFLGLNMTGAEVSMFSYPDFLPAGHWKTMVEKEKITDLIISDIMVTPDLWKEIQYEKGNLGLRNVLLFHSKMGGPTVGPAELTFNEFNYHWLKSKADAVFISDLFDEYKDTPISLGKAGKDDIAFICHTSGTTKGIRKPIIYRERDLLEAESKNTFFDCRLNKEYYGEQQRSAIIFDFSAFHSLWTGALSGLINGNTTVLTFFGFLHPKFIKAVEYYRLNSMLASGFMIDTWLKRDDIDEIDLSSLEAVFVAGSFLSQESKARYIDFFRDHGCTCDIATYYGMSEVYNNGFLSQFNDDDMGIADIKEFIRIRDEKDNRFYTLDDGARSGILYMTSFAICKNTLDGEKLFDYTTIDGRDYICTNDLVRIEEDGRVVFVGRSDKYFVNNDGKRFDSGIVETQLSRQPDIDRCAIAPVLEKRIHDTVPILYVIPRQPGDGADERIRKALVDIYVKEKKIDSENIPVQLMIVDNIPVNQSGKIDIYKITRERLLGEAYNIVPVRKNGKLTDIKLEYVEKLNSIVAAVPEGMGESSAFNIFEIFNDDSSDGKKEYQMPWKWKTQKKKRKKDVSIVDIIKAVKADKEMAEIGGKIADRILVNIMNSSGRDMGMRDYDYDIEE